MIAPTLSPVEASGSYLIRGLHWWAKAIGDAWMIEARTGSASGTPREGRARCEPLPCAELAGARHSSGTQGSSAARADLLVVGHYGRCGRLIARMRSRPSPRSSIQATR
jgi:hypothetical protein